jgi:lon-related putative ATP-dependent protease
VAPSDPLPPSALRRLSDVADLPFETTAELEPLDRVLGQERAVDAIRFGTELREKGWNVFALGSTGSGRHTVVRDILERKSKDEPVPPDFCYVHDFDDPHKPRALILPTGLGTKLRDDMARLMEDLSAALPAAFEGDEYRQKRMALDEALEKRQEEALEKVREFATEHAVKVTQNPVGFAIGPAKGEEKAEELSPEEKQKIEDAIEEISNRLQAVLEEAPKWHKEHRDRVRELDRETTLAAVLFLIDALKARYDELPDVLAHLDRVQADVMENAKLFIVAGARDESEMTRADYEPPILRRYAVNVIVSNEDTEGAPVVAEDYPNVRHLVGKIEHVSRLGTLTTDFSLIKPGALHRANGGYLILDVRKVLSTTLAWDVLKRTLRAGEIRIEAVPELLGLSSAASLEPEPIPLDVKVVLVGERRLYYLLDALDPDLGEHFKVAADFEDDLESDDDGVLDYARLVSRLVRDKELRALDREAVARVVDRSRRWAGDQERLSTNIRLLADLLVEANHWAGVRGRETVSAEDVDHAIEKAEHRLDRIRDRVLRAIRDRTLRIETEGRAVGQVNALSVSRVGSFEFGRPSRVTAKVRLGKGEVVDIEREVELGGPIHSKGVMILSGFLGSRFARDQPLTLSASLVFEQSYGGIDGDSASLAELCALISALAEVPIRQDRALTGSVDQRGNVQPVGGINEKIEGFYDACEAIGDVEGRAVLIPEANRRHLMLRDDVVQAAREGRFAIYPVSNVDEALELLTDVSAGERDAGGRYPRDSINGRAQARLDEMAQAARKHRSRSFD